MKNESANIEPHKVTKPIQLLAAWLVGLIAIDAGFLVAAVKIGDANWTSGALVVAAIVNVPMFLVAIFLLQTKFRPELQEDSYYSEYLDKKSNKIVTAKLSSESDLDVIKRIEQIQGSVSSILDNQSFHGVATVHKWSGWKVAVNDLHKNIDEIRRSLATAGIPIAEYFGSSSIKKEPPSVFLIAFRDIMDAQSCIQVLRQVALLGFDGYYYFDDPREIDAEDVYLGPYGDKEKYIPINEKLIELLSIETLNSATFKKFEEDYA